MSALALDETGDLRVDKRLSLVTGIEEVIQKIEVQFQFFLGEWFLDKRLGVPNFEIVFVKNPDLVLVRGVYRKLIVETPGVDSLTRLDLDLNKVTRGLTTSFTAIYDKTGEPFDYSKEFILWNTV